MKTYCSLVMSLQMHFIVRSAQNCVGTSLVYAHNTDRSIIALFGEEILARKSECELFLMHYPFLSINSSFLEQVRGIYVCCSSVR